MKKIDFNSNSRKPYTSPTMKVVEMELGSLMDASVRTPDQESPDGELEPSTSARIFRGLIDDTDMEYFEENQY